MEDRGREREGEMRAKERERDRQTARETPLDYRGQLHVTKGNELILYQYQTMKLDLIRV